MGKVLAGITVSVDGFITGPGDGPGCGLGVGGERLHYRVFGGPWSYDSPARREPAGEDKAWLEETMGANGAVIAGRGTYEAAGHWGGKNPWGIPFVVTHRPAGERPGNGFAFAFAGSLAEAIDQAKAAAGEKQVHAMGGADLIRQALAAGLADELTIIIAPVALGAGERLTGGFGESLELEHLGVRQSPFATSIDYRVNRRQASAPQRCPLGSGAPGHAAVRKRCRLPPVPPQLSVTTSKVPEADRSARTGHPAVTQPGVSQTQLMLLCGCPRISPRSVSPGSTPSDPPWPPVGAGRRAFSRIVPVTQRHTVERHHLEANRAVGSFHTGLAARRGRMLADMTIQRMDNVAIVVDDLDAAVAFFTELGMELEGKGQIEGLWADRAVGLDGVRSDIAMMRTPDGHSKLELTRYHAPAAVGAEPENPPPNTLGLHRVMFAVDDIHDTVARLRAHGAELLGEVAQYESIFLLCYLRGPAGIIVALAEQIG